MNLHITGNVECCWMKINFNTLGLASGGGNRVIIELANRLVDRGHDVTITAITLDSFSWYGKENVKAKLNTAYPSVLTRLIRQRIRHEHYFDVQADLLQKITPDCDVNIATFCLTVAPTIQSKKGKPFYLVSSAPNTCTHRVVPPALDCHRQRGPPCRAAHRYRAVSSRATARSRS